MGFLSFLWFPYYIKDVVFCRKNEKEMTRFSWQLNEPPFKTDGWFVCSLFFSFPEIVSLDSRVNEWEFHMTLYSQTFSPRSLKLKEKKKKKKKNLWKENRCGDSKEARKKSEEKEKQKNKRANWWWLHPSNRIDGFWAGETAGATSHFHRVGPSLQTDSKIKFKKRTTFGRE